MPCGCSNNQPKKRRFGGQPHAALTRHGNGKSACEARRDAVKLPSRAISCAALSICSTGHRVGEVLYDRRRIRW
eukprot:6171969-Pleurochrysis_carterae.AAC.1